jgi:hypothetical protein
LLRAWDPPLFTWCLLVEALAGSKMDRFKAGHGMGMGIMADTKWTLEQCQGGELQTHQIERRGWGREGCGPELKPRGMMYSGQ